MRISAFYRWANRYPERRRPDWAIYRRRTDEDKARITSYEQHINSEVHITLTADEALVLFELLSRYSDSGQLNIIDQAEQKALWNLCCILEKKSVAPFNMEYGQALSEARARLRDEEQFRTSALGRNLAKTTTGQEQTDYWTSISSQL